MDTDKVARKEFWMQKFHTPEMLRSMMQEIDYRSAALPVEATLNSNYPR
jgi:negative regulator of genetic competence, sporulation and motility